MKKVHKKTTDKISLGAVEKLLDQQTLVILSAVDDRLRKTREDIRSDTKSEINKLANTLDKFLKRLTDFNDEFEIVKAKVNKIEKILQTKLGVSVS